MTSTPSWPRRRVLAAIALVAALTALAAGPADAQLRKTNPDVGDGEIRSTPYRYASEEGQFQVTWPSGCGELKIRANDADPFAEGEEAEIVLVQHVSCDQYGVEGEGCSVTASLDVRDRQGRPAGPAHVVSRVRKVLEAAGVKLVRQQAIKKEYPDGLKVEGLEVFGTAADGSGQFWVRGLLVYHDIYILSGWSARGDLWDNPEFQTFFNEFVPYTE
ncbi:hypothetical protein KDM41_02980 [bacterium]|nr:hypothetical protein [bacterium]